MSVQARLPSPKLGSLNQFRQRMQEIVRAQLPAMKQLLHASWGSSCPCELNYNAMGGL